jgi:hypothetical protein
METWFRLPVVVRVALVVVASFGYAFLVLSLLSPESADRIAMYVGMACVMGASVTAGVDQRTQAKYGSIEQLQPYRRALRTGELPADIELDTWRRWLRGSALWNVTAFVSAAPFVFLGLMSSVYSQSAYRWVPAAAFVLLSVWALSHCLDRMHGSSDWRPQ